jgi:hypothetical protein
MLDELFQDFRISVRGLLRTPLFAVTVILTLALGIGTTTAIFSIGDRLLLRPLPYPHAEQKRHLVLFAHWLFLRGCEPVGGNRYWNRLGA